MQQNLINYRQRISRIVQPAPFFRERKRSETLQSEPPQLTKKFLSLHLPEIQLFASQDKSFDIDMSGFNTTQLVIFNDQEAKSLKKSVILTRNTSPKNRKLQRRGTLLMLDEEIQRKFENWQTKFRKKATNDHVHTILNNFVELFAAMHLKHLRHLVDIYSDVAVQIQENPVFMIRFTLVIATFFLEIKEYSKCSFLCRQAFVISKMLSLNKERTRVMLFFAKINQSLQQYQQSLKYLEDSLAYSWYGNQQDEEALSYEAIGLSLFYMQQQTKARVFHFKYVNGQFEPHDSPLRIQAVQQICFSEQLQVERGEKQVEINDIVLAKLALPFQAKERKKTIKKIDITQHEDIFKIMISELSEAVQYEAIFLRDVQRVAPKIKIKEVGAFTEKFLETKRKATILQWKQRERINSLTIDRNLKEYIKQRNKSIENCELVFKRVKDGVGFKQQKELEPIYIQQYQNKNVIQYIKKEFEQYNELDIQFINNQFILNLENKQKQIKYEYVCLFAWMYLIFLDCILTCLMFSKKFILKYC